MKKLFFLVLACALTPTLQSDNGHDYSQADINTITDDYSAKVEFKQSYLYLKASSSWPCHQILLYPRMTNGGAMDNSLRDLMIQVVFVDPASGTNKVLYYTKFPDRPDVNSNTPPTLRVVFNSAGTNANPAHYRIYAVKPVYYGSNIYYGPGGRPATLLRRDQLYDAEQVFGIAWVKQATPCNVDDYINDPYTLLLNETPEKRPLHALQGLRDY